MKDNTHPLKMDLAMRLVSSAENSTLEWKENYKYIEDIDDGRGYTAGIIGFCSGTGDMLKVVKRYTEAFRNNVLAKYLPALEKMSGSDSDEDDCDEHGSDSDEEDSDTDDELSGLPDDWCKAANDPKFRKAQDAIRDEDYFNPAIKQAKKDGLRALGQFIYFDAIVMHGPGEKTDRDCFQGIHKKAMKKADTPRRHGKEKRYLEAFLDAREASILRRGKNFDDISRVEAQRGFLKDRNYDLVGKLEWTMYGDHFETEG
jgi:chitosanase